METLARVLSRPQAKPYRTRQINSSKQIHLDDRGLLEWSPDDVENPKNWSRSRRWYITVVCILLVVNASMASSSPSGCLPSIEEGFGVSSEVAKLTVTFFVLGFCTGPSVWAPLSEYYGRRIVFMLTFVIYFSFTFLCAFAPNIEALLIARFFTGAFVSGILSNAPGIFADLWGPIERGNSMLFFTCALQMGPALGPITSGFYQLKLDWRWNFYQLLWMSGFSLLFLPTIPETLPSRALLNKARRIRKAQIPGYENVQAPIEVEGLSLAKIFKVALSRPWRILVDPIASLIAVYMTVVYSLLYMLFTLFPIAFIEIRGWNAGVGELPLLSVCIGALIALPYVYWDSVRQRKSIAGGHKHSAEDTLRVAMAGAIALPIGMFWFAWSAAYASVHWIVPCIGGVVLSFAITTLFVAFLSYLSEAYLMYAASAQACNQIVRSGVAAAAPLYTKQMFNALGVGGGGSLIGGIAILLLPIPFVFYKYGRTIREKSKFAPTQQADHKTEESRAVETLAASLASETSEDKRQEEVEEPRSDSDSVESDRRFDHSNAIEKGDADKH